MKKVLLTLAITLLCVTIRPDGALDTTFGDGAGYVAYPIGFFASGVAVQSDGRIVVAGSDAHNSFQLVRYNTDGTLDTTFGANFNGIATGPIGLLFDVLVQPDGFIIAGGQDTIGNFQLARFYPEGFVDSSFGVNGIIIGSTGFCSALAQEQDGNILVAGADNGGYFNDSHFFVVRYDNNGQVDTFFDLGPLGYVEDLIIQSDGKAVVCGVDNDAQFSVVRYNIDGSLDISFGVNGVVTGPLGIATSLIVQPDGYIVVAGFDLNTPATMLLTRYTATGNIDTTFGVDGIVHGVQGVINGIALQSDGKIIVVGEESNNALVVRFNGDGSQDFSFGVDGVATVLTGLLYGVAFQTDGKIVAVGLDHLFSNFLVARYTNDQNLASTLVSYPITAASGIVNIHGVAQNPSEVFLFLDGQLLGGTSTGANDDDTWNYAVNLPSPGMYNLRAVSSYKAGNLMSAGAQRLRIHS